MKLKTLATALLLGAVFLSHAKAGGTAVPIQSGYQISYASNGTPLVTSSPATVSPGAASGEARIMEMFKSPGPAGKTLEVSAARTIPWSTIARGVARAAGWIGIGMALYDLFGGERMEAVPGGGIKWDAGQPKETVTGYSCSTGGYGGWGADGDIACAALIGNIRKILPAVGINDDVCLQRFEYSLGRYNNEQWVMKTISITTKKGGYPAGWCGYDSTTPFGKTTIIAESQQACPMVNGARPDAGKDGKCPTGVYAPITEAQAAAKIEAQGDKSKAVPAVRELLEHGEQFDPQPAVSAAGPATVESEPRTRTETDAQGNTKTTTVKDVYHITYEGDHYTWNQTTVTTNPDGSTTEETDPDPEKVTPPSDPSMPDQPTLYTQKYPDGLAGVWNQESIAVKQTPIFTFLQGLNPNLGNGGCPNWSFDAGDVLHIHVGGNISIPCYVWSFLRLCFTISALMLARRLIFGG